jgi:SP family sugar:H+ symporter-like MFS transporter
MIIFACFFIAGFAMTWGPIIWALVGEIYPSRYRAKCMALATASNWIWNFLISCESSKLLPYPLPLSSAYTINAVFTPYITAAIDFRYGYIFAACCFAGAAVVYFFVCESQNRTLEEIDTMYVLGVNPLKSKGWQPPEGDDLPNVDNLYLTKGARGIRKRNEAGAAAPPLAERQESVVVPNGGFEASGARQ